MTPMTITQRWNNYYKDIRTYRCTVEDFSITLLQSLLRHILQISFYGKNIGMCHNVTEGSNSCGGEKDLNSE